MADADRIFELHLERALLRAQRLAALARPPHEVPGWVTDQLAEVERQLRAAGPSPTMAMLAERAHLEPAAEELLWTLVAAAAEPRAQIHLVAALGPEARRGLSAGAYAALAELDRTASRAVFEMLHREHQLLAHRLLEPADERLTAATPLAVPRRVIDHLAGLDGVDELLAGLGGVVWPPGRPRLDERQRAVVDRLREALGASRQAVLIVEGPGGSGRRSAVAIAATDLGRTVVAIDAAGVPVAEAPRVLGALHREVLLRGAVPVIANADGWAGLAATGGGAPRALLEFVRGNPGVTVVTGRPGGLELATDAPVVRFTWDLADHATRQQIWGDLLAGQGSELEAQVGHLSHRYRLGPGGIERAVASARMLAATAERGHRLAVSDVVRGVRSNIAERLRAHAHRIEVVESWDDLILPADQQDTLRRVIHRVRHAHRVYEEWGFKRRASRGTGVSVLFSGPPGTGKTMAAGLIARELELELYQIDLSQVVSKWVGETEKNLGQLFEAAEAGHALLLFDEADALFAKRATDVKGAQDRYANLEVNYLLQRIEAFAGIAILTTNLDTSIDSALKRRLAAHVIFYPPDEDERALLWRRMATSGAAPVACDDDDYAHLAREFPDMSGAHIRNAVLAAAFVAAAEGGPITRDRLAGAARSEYRSMGRVLAQRL